MFRKSIIPLLLVLSACGESVENVDVDLLIQDYCNCVAEENYKLSQRCVTMQVNAKKKLESDPEKLDVYAKEIAKCDQQILENSHDKAVRSSDTTVLIADTLDQ